MYCLTSLVALKATLKEFDNLRKSFLWAEKEKLTKRIMDIDNLSAKLCKLELGSWTLTYDMQASPSSTSWTMSSLGALLVTSSYNQIGRTTLTENLSRMANSQQDQPTMHTIHWTNANKFQAPYLESLGITKMQSLCVVGHPKQNLELQ